MAKECLKSFQSAVVRWAAADSPAGQPPQLREERLQRMLDGTPMFIGELAMDGTFTDANLALRQLLDLGRHESIGRKLWDCSCWSGDATERSRRQAAFDRAVCGETVRFDEAVRGLHGDPRIIELTLQPSLERGRVVCVIASAIDVTRFRQTEEEAQRRTDDVAQLMDLVPVAVWVSHDSNCKTITGNRMANALYGIDSGENVSVSSPNPVRAKALRFFDGQGRELAPSELPMQQAATRNAAISGQELHIEQPDGARRVMVGSAAPLRDAAGSVRGCLAAFLEVTAQKQAEAAWREQEARFFTLAEVAPALVFWIDASGRNGHANRRWMEYFDIPIEDALRQNWQGIVHADDLDEANKLWGQCLVNGTPFERQLRLIGCDGVSRWHLSRTVPLRDANGTVTGWCGTASDIHELTLQKRQLGEREELLRAITEAIPDPVFAKDLDGRMLLANSATLRAIGRTAAEVIGRAETEWHDDASEAAAIRANDQRIMDAGETELVEEQLTTSAGTLIFSGRKAPLRNNAGTVIGLVGVSRDVTEQRAAEQALRDREERLRLALRGGGMGMWEFDLARRRVLWDDKQKELWGFEPVAEDGNTETIFARIHPDDRGMSEGRYRSAMLGESKLFESEFRILRPDGSIRWLASFGTLADSSAGQRVIGVNYDITERKQAEAALRERERELQALADNSPDILARFDRDLRHVFISAAVERATGRSRQEFLGKTNRELGMPTELCDRWDAVLREVFADGCARNVEFRYAGPSGTRIYEARLIPELGENAKIQSVLSITRDRTAEHAAVVALREAQERFQLALEQAPVILFTQDRELRYTWLHKPTAPWSEPDSLGKTDAEFIAAEDARPIEELKREAIRTGRGLRSEVSVRLGGKLEYFDLTIEPIKDEQGVVTGIACAALEISGLKHAEAELRVAARQKDEFLATLAHELRNPLAPLRTGLHVLKLSPNGGPAADKARELMERQLTHMVRLIDDLLDVARISQGKVQLQRKTVELRPLIDGAIEAAQPSIKMNRHELTVELPDAPIWLDVDPIRLVQVVTNLLTNAAKYTPEGGHIHLCCRREEQSLEIVVTDDGMGLPADMLEKVFEMFAQVNRSLERSQGGLGIGLALVRRLIEMHGGKVFAESAGLERGSRFTVRLPVDSPPTATAVLARSQSHTAPPGQRILIVDDNTDAADSIAELLQLMGYDSRTAYDGPQGLAVAVQFKPHIIFLDIGLPGMSGYEVATRVRSEPSLRGAALVALTGWGSSEDRRRAEQAGFDLHLTKPVDAAAMVEVLERLAR